MKPTAFAFSHRLKLLRRPVRRGVPAIRSGVAMLIYNQAPGSTSSCLACVATPKVDLGLDA